MKNFKIIYALILCVGFMNCKKDTEQRDDVEEDDTTVFTNPFEYTPAPCSPDTNSCYYNGFKLDFGSASFYNNPYYLSSGYVIEGSTYPGGGYSIEFRAKPKTQKYVTKYYSDISSNNEVYVSGTFGLGLSYHYPSSEGDTVYVQVIDEANEIYHVTFCDLEFHNSSAQLTTFRTDGNLTSN